MRPRPLHLLLLALLIASPSRAEEFRFTLLHTTDLHGALTAYDYLNDRPYPRGLTKIASMVHAIRAEGRPTLLLDAGDCMSGGPLEIAWRRGPMSTPEPMIAAMNLMGYDAMAVGNHEFDLSPAEFEQLRGASTFPWLAANIYGKPALARSLVKDLGGVRVGIVGLCTPAVPSLADSANLVGLNFGSPLEAATDEVARLRGREHCDVIVLLAHTGLEHDPATGAERRGGMIDENWGERIANGVKGADILILGHTHAVLPFARIGGTLVTQAGKWAEDLGRVDFTLTRGGAGEPWKVSARANVLAVTDSVGADSALAAFAQPYHDAAQTELAKVMGYAVKDLTAHGRTEDSPPWELIQSVQRAASGADVSLASLADGSLRLGSGPVTLRDLIRLYPFDNTLVTIELTGAQLRQTLETSAEYFATYTFEHGRSLTEGARQAYDYDAASGVSYEIDLTRPPGERIVNLSRHGAPLDPNARLKVAISSYRAGGGGGFEELRTAPRLSRSRKSIRDLIADYLHATGPIDPAFERDWRVLPDYVSTPERPLIDLLVRQGVAPAAQLLRLGANEPAVRGDLMYWLSRAYGWRSKHASFAFRDVPDSLSPWLDGLLKHKVFGSESEEDFIQPYRPMMLAPAFDWCVRAASASGYALVGQPALQSFQRSLMTGVGGAADWRAGHVGWRDTLTRSQVLGMVANTRFPTVRVLETTDVHGYLLPGATERRTGRAIGGSPVLAAWISKLTAENPEGTVLLDGGDLFQGTMISNLQFGRPMVEQMNVLHYAATAIGNHEFDWTADTLARRVREMKFAALGANLVEKKSGRRPAWVRSDTAFVRRGVHVGVFGLCYRATPSVTLAQNVAHLKFLDDSTTAARLVPRLRHEGAEVLVEVGHIPAETDSTRRATSGDLLRLARGVPGVDLWLGGHSHNQVLDEVKGVPLMISGAHGEVVGVCDLVVDPIKHRVVEHRARLQVTYADEVTPDRDIAARLERWNAGVAPLAAVEIGRNARALTRSGRPESTVGDFVADAMREATGADLAMQNSGGLRADLAEGVIAKGRIYEVMPFDNTIVMMELTGAEIRRVFEEGLRYNRVAQLSGVRIVYDADQPEFQRVKKLTLADGTALVDTKTYRVAVNNFMATGGDNFDTLAKGRNSKDTGLLVRATLEDYVAKRAKRGEAVDLQVDGRIERLGAKPAAGDSH